MQRTTVLRTTVLRTTVLRTTVLLAVSCSLTLGLAAPVMATLEHRDGYFMDESEEARLALTAGPPAVTEGASVYVLRADGYKLAEQGGNGFHCFVERSWAAPSPTNAILFNPRIRAPHCINPEGAQSTMQEKFLVARLALDGLDGEAINQRVEKAYMAGELREPKGLALTYMMSRHQWLGKGPKAWKPHVMIWMPGLTEAEVGAVLSKPTNDTYLVGKPGSRRACLTVAVSDFVD